MTHIPSLLIVDDDHDVREMLQTVFEDDGYTVFTATNGLEALEAMALERPALIISDLRMPLMDGPQLYRQIQRHPQYHAIPFVLMTGLTPPEVATYRIQPETVVYKPIQVAKLVTVVEQILATQYH